MRRMCRSRYVLAFLPFGVINLVPEIRYGCADRHPLNILLMVLVPLDAALAIASMRLDLLLKDSIGRRNVNPVGSNLGPSTCGVWDD